MLAPMIGKEGPGSMFEIEETEKRQFLPSTHIVHVNSLGLDGHDGLLRIEDGRRNASDLAVVHTKQDKTFDTHGDDFAIPAESGC